MYFRMNFWVGGPFYGALKYFQTQNVRHNTSKRLSPLSHTGSYFSSQSWNLGWTMTSPVESSSINLLAETPSSGGLLDEYPTTEDDEDDAAYISNNQEIISSVSSSITTSSSTHAGVAPKNFLSPRHLRKKVTHQY